MRQRRVLLTVLIVVTLVALAPAAHASPPDPTWLSGLWDDADHDNVVTVVTETSGLTEECLDYDFGRVGCATIKVLTDDHPLAVHVSLKQPRAPPI
jgi:hypothetical protein